MGVGRRAMNVAVMAGALAALVQSLPDQSMREQIRDMAAAIESEAEALADELEFSDELLTAPGIKAA